MPRHRYVLRVQRNSKKFFQKPYFDENHYHFWLDFLPGRPTLNIDAEAECAVPRCPIFLSVLTPLSPDFESLLVTHAGFGGTFLPWNSSHLRSRPSFHSQLYGVNPDS